MRSISQESGPVKVVPDEYHSHTDIKNVIPAREIEDKDAKRNGKSN